MKQDSGTFGENYLQESLEKIEQLQDLDICWHFIGPIQSNKTRPVSESFSLGTQRRPPENRPAAQQSAAGESCHP